MNYSRLMLQFCPRAVSRGLHIASSEKEHSRNWPSRQNMRLLRPHAVCMQCQGLCTKGDDDQQYFRGRLKFTANAGLCRPIQSFQKASGLHVTNT